MHRDMQTGEDYFFQNVELVIKHGALLFLLYEVEKNAYGFRTNMTFHVFCEVLGELAQLQLAVVGIHLCIEFEETVEWNLVVR